MQFIDKYVPSGSSFSGDIDNLILVVGLIVGFWFFAALGLFFFLIVRFTARDGVKAMYISGEKPSEKRWVTWPHNITLVFDIMIVVMALKVWTDIKIALPQADQTVRVIAQQWAWTFVHPGPDGKLDTSDDIKTIDELHVEINKTYHFELQSRDVLHSFSVPVFRLKQDIIPGRTIKGWFKPTITGNYQIQCTEICGIGHALMPGRILIESPEEHQNWVKKNAPEVAALEGATPTSLGGTP
jgi:cytochrome c oxidase subunit II